MEGATLENRFSERDGVAVKEMRILRTRAQRQSGERPGDAIIFGVKADDELYAVIGRGRTNRLLGSSSRGIDADALSSSVRRPFEYTNGSTLSVELRGATKVAPALAVVLEDSSSDNVH